MTSGRVIRLATASTRRCTRQFHPLEAALQAPPGVTVWLMVELEADDALAAAARIAPAAAGGAQVCIWTPDKDLAQCVQGERRAGRPPQPTGARTAAAVLEKSAWSRPHPGPARPRGRQRGRLPGSAGSPRRRGAPHRPPGRSRLPPQAPRGAACARAAVQDSWLRCAPMPHCSAGSMSCDGPGRPRTAAMAEQLGEPKLLARATRAAAAR